MNQELLDGARRISRTIQEKNAEIRRLEIANAELVRRCAEYERKYVIASTLMRRLARLRGFERWLARYMGDQPGFVRDREVNEHDRWMKAMVDKPWEVVTDL